MRVIIAGSRGIEDRAVIRRAIEDADLVFGPVDEFIHGSASGVDTIGAEIAEGKGFDVAAVPAQWDEHGRSAGPIRNMQMAHRADALVAVWDGESSGTRDMIDKALDNDLEVLVVRP